MLIVIDGNTTAVDISKILGISLRTVRRYLDGWKNSGVITRTGARKTGFWRINISDTFK
ncbi:MAG: helix-turn-helix domain-containing protein [Mangrovibacterium sp.]